MAQIVAIHAAREGAGKSTFSAALATSLALAGRRIGLVDAVGTWPGLPGLFGAAAGEKDPTFGDYLRGACEIDAAAHDVGAQFGVDMPGCVFVVPCGPPLDIGPEVILERSRRGFERLTEQLALDALLVDVAAGAGHGSLGLIAATDVALIVLRIDPRLYQGTSVLIDLLVNLDFRRLLLAVNDVPATYDAGQVKQAVVSAYHVPDVVVLPHSDLLVPLGGARYVALHREDGYSQQVRAAGEWLFSSSDV